MSKASMSDEERRYRRYMEAQTDLLDDMFTGLLSPVPRKSAKDYFYELVQGWADMLESRATLSHAVIQRSIERHLKSLGWDVESEVLFDGLDSRRRFDIVATKGTNKIVLEVKREITTQDLGQVEGYAFDVKRQWKKARLFLGTDIRSFGQLLRGSVSDSLFEKARRQKVGIFFADKKKAAVIPAEFLLVFADELKQSGVRE